MNKIEITGYGYDGEGVGRLKGKVCFVPFTLSDEIVHIEIEKEKSSFCQCKKMYVEKESKNRVKAPCQYFETCGGCMLQHTTHKNELDIKKQLLAGQLNKVGFDGDIEVVPSEKEYGYRNKIKIFVGDKNIGLKERKSDKICDVEKCLICDDKINHAIEQIRTFIKSKKLFKYIYEVAIRSTGEKCLVNFYVKENVEINYQGLQLMLGSDYGIFQTYKNQTIHVLGQPCLEVEDFGLKCRFSPTTFQQVNKKIAAKLYEDVVKNIVGKSVLNLYSGAGLLSGIIASQNKVTVGVELGKSEHEDAEKLKEMNNLFYLRNICGDCKDVIEKIEQKFDTVVVDPPRSGMDEKVCEKINQLACKELIYVSCNSATLVRDIGRLTTFKIKQVKLYDMFPKTGEYEVFAVLTKK